MSFLYFFFFFDNMSFLYFLLHSLVHPHWFSNSNTYSSVSFEDGPWFYKQDLINLWSVIGPINVGPVWVFKKPPLKNSWLTIEPSIAEIWLGRVESDSHPSQLLSRSQNHRPIRPLTPFPHTRSYNETHCTRPSWSPHSATRPTTIKGQPNDTVP